MRKIKLLHVGLTSEVGGVETYIYHLYKNIDKEKFDVYFLINKNEIVYKYEELNKMGAKFIHIENRRKNIIKYLKDLKKCYKNYEFDFIHFHTSKYSHFLKYIYAFKYSNAKIIIHSHQYRPNGFPSKVTKVLDTIGRFLISKHAAYYVACSTLAYDFMFKNFKGGIDSNTKIFNNGIDLKKFIYNEKSRIEIRKELKIDDKIVYGHVGRFAEQKNHEFLIEVFDEIYKKDKNSILLLLGDGPLVEKVKKKVYDKKLNNVVIFLGNKDNVSDYMSAMDALLFPSLYEGLGLVLVEAQACNLRIFASDTVIPQEAKVSELLTFISLNKKPEEWADIIINCDLSKIDVRNLIKRKNYDIATSTKIVEDFYIANFRGGKYIV